MTAQAEWTVLVFLNAKNNLEPFAFPNFLQMATIGSTDEVKLVVEMGRPKQHYTDDDNGFGQWSKNLRFFIEKGTQPTEKCAVKDMGDVNMGDPKSLVDFVKWGRATYPAKHTMLIIWNHGQGWRFPPPGHPKHANAQLAGGFRYVSSDDDTGDKLYNRQIQDSLTELLAGERLDIIAFDACLMAMVETAYALRGVARVMVGSEELEPGEGWDYARWVKALTDAKGNMTPEQLAVQLVRGMADQYGNNVDTTLSAIALDRVDELASAISKFATTAIPFVTAQNLAAFKTARTNCSSYGSGFGIHSIDLARYLQEIIKVAPDPSVSLTAMTALVALEAAILDHEASASRQAAYGSNGLSIYYPASASAKAGDRDGSGYDVGNTKYPVEFVQTQQWVAFLTAYWHLVP